MIVCCFFCLCNTVFFAYQKGANFHCTALRGRVFHVDLFFRLKFPRNAATIKYRFPFNQVSSCRNRSSALHVLGRAAAAQRHTAQHTHRRYSTVFRRGSLWQTVFWVQCSSQQGAAPTQSFDFPSEKGCFGLGGPKGHPRIGQVFPAQKRLYKRPGGPPPITIVPPPPYVT